MPISRPTVSVTYRFEDQRGKGASISFDADAAQPLEIVQQAAAAVAEQLALISEARLSGYTLTYSVLYHPFHTSGHTAVSSTKA